MSHQRIDGIYWLLVCNGDGFDCIEFVSVSVRFSVRLLSVCHQLQQLGTVQCDTFCAPTQCNYDCYQSARLTDSYNLQHWIAVPDAWRVGLLLLRMAHAHWLSSHHRLRGKGDQPFQWENPKFNPAYFPNPLIFPHQNLHRWLRPAYLPICKI